MGGASYLAPGSTASEPISVARPAISSATSYLVRCLPILGAARSPTSSTWNPIALRMAVDAFSPVLYFDSLSNASTLRMSSAFSSTSSADLCKTASVRFTMSSSKPLEAISLRWSGCDREAACFTKASLSLPTSFPAASSATAMLRIMAVASAGLAMRPASMP